MGYVSKLERNLGYIPEGLKGSHPRAITLNLTLHALALLESFPEILLEGVYRLIRPRVSYRG